MDGEVREELQVNSKKQNNAWFTTIIQKPEQELRLSSQLTRKESIKQMSTWVNSKKDLYLAAITEIEQNFDSQVFTRLVS